MDIHGIEVLARAQQHILLREAAQRDRILPPDDSDLTKRAMAKLGDHLIFLGQRLKGQPREGNAVPVWQAG